MVFKDHGKDGRFLAYHGDIKMGAVGLCDRHAVIVYYPDIMLEIAYAVSRPQYQGACRGLDGVSQACLYGLSIFVLFDLEV